MPVILHPNAKTTPKIRKEIHESKESLAKLAKKYNLNIKTVAKWKKTSSFEDGRSGAKKVRSVLTEQEQAIICEFRRTTRLPLDDVYIALKDKIPNLSRSNVHRCLKRNGLNVLPKEEDEKPKKPTKKFKSYEIGFLHIDIAQVRTSEGKAYLFVAIDRKTRSVYAELYDNMTADTACLFLENTIAHFPFMIHKILTDNGSQFTYRLMAKHLSPKGKAHPFDAICQKNNIEYRLTKFAHPWTNGLVERMNRTIKEATVKVYFYQDLKELKRHLMLWLLAYNFEKKLKSLQVKTPFEIMRQEFDNKPSNFVVNPNHKIWGLNN